MLRFAIDPSKNVMTPKDPSVTSAGNEVLSPGDIVKLQCLYNCDGTNPGTCGGHISGDSGVVESSGPITFTSSGTGKKICKWLISATSGEAIQLTYQSFNVLCGKGELRLHDGQDDTDGRPFPSLLTYTLCTPETAPFSPGIITTTSKYLYITFETEDDSNNFKLAWKAVTVSCCSSITVSSTLSAVLDDSVVKHMLGK